MKAYYHVTGRRCNKTTKRKQFNVTMDEVIILKVRLIAAILKVPTYSACEHVLQVGSNHMLQDLKNRQSREGIRRELVKAPFQQTVKG